MVHAASNLHLRPVLPFFSGVRDILLDIAKKNKMWLFASPLPQAHELGSIHQLGEPCARKPVSIMPDIKSQEYGKASSDESKRNAHLSSTIERSCEASVRRRRSYTRCRRASQSQSEDAGGILRVR